MEQNMLTDVNWNRFIMQIFYVLSETKNIWVKHKL